MESNAIKKSSKPGISLPTSIIICILVLVIGVAGMVMLIGAFFGRTEDQVAKNEIIVIITPYIISPEEQMIKQEKVDIVKRAEEAHDDKQNTFDKLFSQKRMYEQIQGAGDREAFAIKNREDLSLSTRDKVDDRECRQILLICHNRP